MAQDEPLLSGGGGNAVHPARPARPADGIDWDAVRHDYLYSGMAQRRVAWKYGISAARLRTRRVAERWERVVPCVPLPTRRVTPRAGEPPTPTQQKRARLTKRLFRVLDAKIAVLGARLMESEGPPQSAADIERDTRSMTALMQIATKLAALDDATRAANENAGTDGARTDDDADRLRRDLADRLRRLNPSGDA